jgi:PAS domain S-box-containing protein
VLGNLRDLVYAYRRDTGECVYVSPSLRDMLGLDPDAFASGGIERLLEAVHPEDRPEVRSALVNGDPDEAAEYRLRHVDGHYLWVQDRRALLRVEGEGSGLLVGSVREAAECGGEASRLAEECRFLDVVVDTVAALIMVVDREGQIVRFNAACERLTGYGEEEVRGRKPWSFLVPDERREESKRLFRSVRDEGSVFRQQSEWVTADGERRLISWGARRVTDGEGKVRYVVGTGADVTEQRRMEERLRRAARMEAVGQLAGGIAHDFNNILTAIIGYADLNLRELSEESPLYGDLARIKDAAKKGSRLTEQLLAFGRGQVVEPEVTELNSGVREVATMLHQLLEENIELELNLADEPLKVELHPAHLEQVLVNLAVNARDAMPDGGTLTVGSARVDLLDGVDKAGGPAGSGPFAELTVRDTGVGMSAEVRERIFDPFFTTKEKDQGTGLGLSVLYGIVERLGGFIDCESRPGRGTTFRVYLPLLGEEAEVTAADTLFGQRFGGDETVLVAEDEERVRQMICRSLESFGYTVLEAANGREALRLLGEQDSPIDLLIADVVMPLLGGRELAAEVRERQPRARVLFISGYAGDEGPEGEQVKGVSPLLQKPFTTSRLAKAVREELDRI